ncbi:MAG: hypothetical protein WAS56_12305 [Saprospiraceae bacterium]
MRNFTIILFYTLVLLSCRKDERDISEAILGQWFAEKHHLCLLNDTIQSKNELFAIMDFKAANVLFYQGASASSIPRRDVNYAFTTDKKRIFFYGPDVYSVSLDTFVITVIDDENIDLYSKTIDDDFVCEQSFKMIRRH